LDFDRACHRKTGISQFSINSFRDQNCSVELMKKREMVNGSKVVKG